MNNHIVEFDNHKTIGRDWDFTGNQAGYYSKVHENIKISDERLI